LSHEEDERSLGVDALYAMAMRLREESAEELPQALALHGDQVYAHKPPQSTLEFIRSRRDTSRPPGEEVADFEEYARLYRDSWADPAIRWLLSTVPSAMTFDDHEVSDDWNISESWVEETRTHPSSTTATWPKHPSATRAWRALSIRRYAHPCATPFPARSPASRASPGRSPPRSPDASSLDRPGSKRRSLVGA
jgi:phosphodiesterase/alkaline phosphatase D-like protein